MLLKENKTKVFFFHVCFSRVV